MNEFWIGVDIRKGEGQERKYEGYGLLINWKRRKILGELRYPNVLEKHTLATDALVAKYNRGVRCIREHKGYIYVLTFASIIKYDYSFNIVDVIYNENLIATHSMLISDSQIVFDNSILDAVVSMDFAGKTIKIVYLGNPACDEIISHEITHPQRVKLQNQGGLLDSLHINNLFVFNNKIYASSGFRSQIFEIPTRRSCVPTICRENNKNLSSHDLQYYKHWTVFNNTSREEIRAYDGERNYITKIPPHFSHAKAQKLVGPGMSSHNNFLRGLAFIDDERVLIGTSPLALHEVCLREEKILGTWIIEPKDLSITCHGIQRKQ